MAESLNSWVLLDAAETLRAKLADDYNRMYVARRLRHEQEMNITRDLWERKNQAYTTASNIIYDGSNDFISIDTPTVSDVVNKTITRQRFIGDINGSDITIVTNNIKDRNKLWLRERRKIVD